MTELITRSYDVEWEVYVPYSRVLDAVKYPTLDEAMDAARQILLSRSPLAYVQISRQETEVTDG